MHPSIKNMSHGLTLIELLVSLAIISILSSLAIPSIQHLLQSNRAHTAQLQLSQLILKARTIAVTQNTYTTLCLSSDGNQCSGDLRGKFILFTDLNKNEQIDGKDQLLRQWSLNDFFEVKMALSARKKFIQFKPTGQSNSTAGRIELCAKDHRYSKGIIVSLVGRIRRSRDTNKDGLDDYGKASSRKLCE